MNKLLWQITRFGTIGVLAATVHFAVVVGIVQTWALPPLIANVFAFMLSFQISYWGHRHYTFVATEVPHRDALPKLLTVQIVNFVANEILYFIFLSLHLPYTVALILVLSILPVFTFITSKLWVFR